MLGLQYMGVLWLVLSEFSSLYCVCSADVAVSTLFDFLELHFTYCASSQLCSIRNNTSSVYEPCCHIYFCENECENEDSCWPDVFLRDVIGNLTFTDAKNWRQNAHHINYSAILQSAEDVYQLEYNNVDDCVDSRLISRECFGSPIITNVYEMVAVCPNRSSADSTVRQLCTVSGQEYIKTMVESNSGDLEVFVRIMTPVTSQKSNITYKNIYCLACSEEGISDSTYISWEAFILDRSYDKFSENLNGNPYEIVANFFTIDNTYCINMKPPKSIQHLTPKKCFPPDFKTCPLGNDVLLDLFCRSFILPVTQIDNKGELTIYKNIACYLCNKYNPVVETCRKYQKGDHFAEMKLNFRPTEGLLAHHLRPSTSFGEMTEKLDWPNNVNTNATVNSSYTVNDGTTEHNLAENLKLAYLNELASVHCNHNYNEFAKCGEVMCPMSFYLSNGECIPTFNSFAGLYFSIHIDVRVKATWTFTKSRLMIVLPVMIKYLDNLAKIFFSEYSFDIWYTMEKEVLRNIVVILNFVSTDPDFISVMNRTDCFLCKMADLRFETPLGIVDFGFKVTNEYFYYFVITDDNTYKPYLRDYYDRTFEPYIKGLQLNILLQNFNILEAMGCYRIVLEELIPINMYGYPQLKNSKIISINTWNLTTYLINYITCLADVLQTEFGISETYMYPGFAGKVLNQIESNERTDIDTNKPGNKATSPFSIGTREAVITAVLVGVAIILITVRICKKRISDSINVSADVESLELENVPK